MPDNFESNGGDLEFGGRIESDDANVAENGGPISRLFVLLLTEAVALGYREIEIDDCRIYYIRGSERLQRDSIPKRVFDRLKAYIATLCGNPETGSPGTLSVSLLKPTRQVDVLVAFGDSKLRITITDVKARSD